MQTYFRSFLIILPFTALASAGCVTIEPSPPDTTSGTDTSTMEASVPQAPSGPTVAANLHPSKEDLPAGWQFSSVPEYADQTQSVEGKPRFRFDLCQDPPYSTHEFCTDFSDLYHYVLTDANQAPYVILSVGAFKDVAASTRFLAQEKQRLIDAGCMGTLLKDTASGNIVRIRTFTGSNETAQLVTTSYLKRHPNMETVYRCPLK
jgi:hypothetical protein